MDTSKFSSFSTKRLLRMKQASLIALEPPCTDRQFLEYCNRYDLINIELESRQVTDSTKITTN